MHILKAQLTTHVHVEDEETIPAFKHVIAWEMAASIYSSLPLNKATEIRLLTLLEAQDMEDPVKCLISKVDLDDAPEYKTVSYCWGRRDRPVSITVNDSALEVTENLGTALRYIRASWAPVTLWIDAVCINQDDDREKEPQISLMERIFSSAALTICWVANHPGPEEVATVGVHLAFLSCPEAIPVEMREGLLAFSGSGNLPWKPDMTVAKAMAQSVEAMVMLVLLMLEQLDYWNRTWIVQEIILSKKIILQGALPGQKGCLSWDTLRGHIMQEDADTNGIVFDHNSTTFVVHNRPILCTSGPPRKIKRLAEMRDAWQRGDPQSRDMLSIMITNVQKDSTDPRDKIWGFLGIADDGQQLTAVDLSLSVTDLYTSWACAFIAKYKSLRVLQNAGIGDSPKPTETTRQHDLPSWVPRWDIGRERGKDDASYSKPLDHHGVLFKACGAREPQWSLSVDQTILSVKGVLADTVSGINDCRSSKKEKDVYQSPPSTCLEWLLEVLGPEAFRVSHDGTHRETVFESFARTLMTDRLPCLKRRLGHGAKYIYLLLCFAKGVICESPDERFANFRGNIFGTASLTWKKAQEPTLTVIHEDSYTVEDTLLMFSRAHKIGQDKIALYASVTGHCMYERVFFLTQRGRMGLGPVGMVESDRICVLYGCSVPVVLREVDGHFVLVGECYVHGLMDGLAVDMLERGELEESLFEIW